MTFILFSEFDKRAWFYFKLHFTKLKDKNYTIESFNNNSIIIAIFEKKDNEKRFELKRKK